MTGRVLRSVKKKHKLWKKWRESHNNNDALEYKKQAKRASKAVRLAKKDFERKIAKNTKSDSKSFYKYVRSKTRVKSRVGPFMDNQGNVVAGDHDMSEMLKHILCISFY